MSSKTTYTSILRLRWAMLCILFIIGAVPGFTQYWVETLSPSQISSCEEYPIEFRLYNDGSTPTSPSTFEITIDSGMAYIPGSVLGAQELDIRQLGFPVFELPSIPACESYRFQIRLDHECITEDAEPMILPIWNVDGNQVAVEKIQPRIFGLSLRLTLLEVYFDSTDLSFKKRYTLINNGKVPLDSFTFYVSGEDNMDILSTSVGQLSVNGDTLHFSPSDFINWGNGNRQLEPGESIEVIHSIDLNACVEAFPFEHFMEVKCGSSTCLFNVISATDLIVRIGNPRLILLQSLDKNAGLCDTGEIFLRLTNRSNIGSFPQANALFNLTLNSGWSVIRNNGRTGPLRDNCLRFLGAEVSGTNIPLQTGGFTGYGLDFKRLTSDPDGPGGLSDVDGDGRFDDLMAGDTIFLRIRYVLNQSCLNVRCNGEVFASRLLRIDSDYNNYCEEELEGINYLGRHNYYWSGTGGSVGGLDGVYATGDVDTLTVRVAKAVNGFLQDCGEDSAVVRITFPPVMSLSPGGVVLVNGDTANYQINGRTIIVSMDSVRGNIVLPVELTCDPNSGGNIQTACTFCLGSGLPGYRIRIEMDYFCRDGCTGRIPFICNQSPEFFSLCDPDAKGIVSEGKFVTEDLIVERQTLGYKDSTRQEKVDPSQDELDLGSLMVHDTFLLKIPFDIRCDANYANVKFQLVQNSIIRFTMGQRDTSYYFEFLSDTLKYWDDPSGRVEICDNVLGPQFFSQRINGYFNSYIKEVDFSRLGCLGASFSTGDSMILIVRGVLRNAITNNMQAVRIRTDLSYEQDRCDQNDRKQITLQGFSGKPHPGFTTLTEPYSRDTNFNFRYNRLSVCGSFELSTYFDNFYYNSDSIDHFENEYRKPFELKKIRIAIPKIFELDSLPYNFIREYYNLQTRIVTGDTTKIPFTISDSSGYHVVCFSPESKEDFFSIRQHFRVNIRPNCYGFIQDSIFVQKYSKIQTQGAGLLGRDTVIQQFYPINMTAIEPIVDLPRQQFLSDRNSVTTIRLNHSTQGYQPDSYFDFHHSWLRLTQKQGNMVIDSLIECTDSIRTLLTPEVIGNGDWLYRLDTTSTHREFKLYSHVENCNRDTIVVEVGSKCSGYPVSWGDSTDACQGFTELREIIFLPEVPQIIGSFVLTPDSTQKQPCDTFDYEVEFKNINLGHLNAPSLQMTKIEGMSLTLAEISLDSFTWGPLGTPQDQGGALVWDLSTYFDSTGFKGFYTPDENTFRVRFSFVGGCDLINGSALNIIVLGEDLCGSIVQTGRVSSPALSFEVDSLSTMSDLYDLDLHFEGDTSCGNIFKLRAVFTSKSDSTNVDDQQVHLTFRKELGYVVNSYQGIKNAANDLYAYRFLEDFEQVLIDIETGILKGDSIVVSIDLERTCVGVCKPTDFKFEVLTPYDLPCPTDPSGACNLLLSSQEWTYDSVVIAPEFDITNITGFITRTPSGDILRIDYEILNRSDFEINTFLKVTFYSDINGDGRWDGGDIFIGMDSLRTQLVNGVNSTFSSELDLGASMPCQFIVVVDPLINPCICESDTLSISTFPIQPISDRIRICFSDSTPIGFDSLDGYTYQWQDPQKVRDISFATTIYEGQLSVPKNGDAVDTLLLEVTRQGGCTAIDTMYVELYRPEAQIAQIDTIRCNGDLTASLKADLVGGWGSTSYLWNKGQNTNIITGLGAGMYEVITSDSIGCSDTISITVAEPDSLEERISLVSDYGGYNIRCNGERTGWVTLEVNGGTPDYSYEWNGNSSNNPRLDSLGAGWTTFLVRDGNGCLIQDSIFLDEPPGLSSVVGATDAGCDSLHFASAWTQAGGGVGSFTYQWSNGAIGDTIHNLDAGTYIVEARDANGCITLDTVEVNRLPDPNIVVSITDTTVEYGTEIRLFAASNANPGVYVWFPSEDVSCDTCTSTIVTPTEFKIIQVKVIDENGCEAWAEIVINVKITKRVWAPNAFTPDGNQVNDGFTLFGNPTLIEIEHLSIYDRWGEMVFNRNYFPPGDPSLGWDGILNGEQMNPAVFAWVGRVRFADGEVRWLSGDVTLVR